MIFPCCDDTFTHRITVASTDVIARSADRESVVPKARKDVEVGVKDLLKGLLPVGEEEVQRSVGSRIG